MDTQLWIVLQTVLVCLIQLAGSAVSAVSYVRCEGQSGNLFCMDTELIYIRTVKYGVFRDMCKKPGQIEEVTTECALPEEVALQYFRDRCHKEESCSFEVTDAALNLTVTAVDSEECGDIINQFNSGLHVIYSCVPGGEWQNVTTEASERVTSFGYVTDGTAPPEPTAASICKANESKIENCSRFVCVNGIWQYRNVDESNPNCCHLGEGCADTNSTEVLVVNLIDENVTSNAQIQSSTVTSTEEITTTSQSTESISTTSPQKTCPKDRYHHLNMNHPVILTWKQTAANLMMTLPCANDTRNPPARIRRFCQKNGEWSPDVDFSNCASDEILDIAKEIQEELDSQASPNSTASNNILNVTERLANVTRTRQLAAGDIHAVTRIIQGVTTLQVTLDIPRADQRKKTITHIAQNVLEVTDNTLNVSHPGWRNLNSSDREAQALDLIEAVEDFAMKAAIGSEGDIEVNSVSSVMKVITVNITTGKTDDVDVQSGDNSVSVPKSNLVPYKLNSDQAKLVTLFHNSTALWNSKQDFIINTQVLSASIVEKEATSKRRQLQTPFRFTLKHQRSADQAKHECSYWDRKKSDWSQDGCRRIDEGADDYSVCECDHMTNFAVLLDVKGSTSNLTEIDVLALRTITYIGCSISILCLFISWLTFLLLKNLSGDRNTIHKHLVFTLMLGEILFLFALNKHVIAMKVLCSVVAGFLHFLFLSVFAWMCLEGVQLYIMLIEVFESGKNRLWYYYGSAYGVPALIVGISVAIDVTQLDYSGYGTDTVCWLETSNGFIWSFVGPAAAVMLLNTIMLVIAIIMMYRHSKMVASMKHKATTRAQTIKNWIKGAIVLIVLLGLTWVFGFMYVSKHTKYFAYLFTILNSFQGLFIFIFHCLCNEKVQKEYKKIVRRTEWLPKCLRVRYGEHKGLSYTISNSSNSNGYFSKLMSRRRKSNDLTSSLRQKKSQYHNTPHYDTTHPHYDNTHHYTTHPHYEDSTITSTGTNSTRCNNNSLVNISVDPAALPLTMDLHRTDSQC